MGLKIKVVIERECCAPGDLRKYQGDVLPGYSLAAIKNTRLSFCQHCGQLWFFTRRPGEMDAGWERVGVADLKA